MDEAAAIREGEALDFNSLEQYLRKELPELKGAMRVQQFHGGHANLTYLLQFDQEEYVLRRPPFGKIAPGAHDMKREYRVLSKLYKFFPQAPKAYHLCEDESVIGAMFVVMERKKGVLLRYKLLDCFKPFENAEERVTVALIKAIADLHKVDVEAAELSELGRPEGFVERQLKGWGKRWELSKTSENKTMDEVFSLLHQNIPKPQAVAIIHNDLKFDNCQFQPDNPDKVTAVFDWDMCTLGDPLVDFGSTLGYWPDELLAGHTLPVMLKGEFPNKQFLIDKYAEYTGFSMERMPWYEAFAYFKAGIILQQLYQRYLKGDSKDSRMAKFEKTAAAFAQIAKQKLVLEA